MKRALLIVGAFTLWIALCSSCYLATNFIDVRMSGKCKTTYTYKNVNRETKTSTRCFETENGNVCKDGVKLVRAIKINEKRICERRK